MSWGQRHIPHEGGKAPARGAPLSHWPYVYAGHEGYPYHDRVKVCSPAHDRDEQEGGRGHPGRINTE